MRILRVRFSGFGRFTNQAIDLDPNLQVIYGPNEAGKTTLINAILGVLYGFKGSRRLRDLRDSYRPWQGGVPYRAAVTFSDGRGQVYEVERDFDQDRVELFRVDTPGGLRPCEADLLPEILARELGINNPVLLESTLLIRQQEVANWRDDLARNPNADKISEALSKRIAQGNDDVSAKEALKALDAKLSALTINGLVNVGLIPACEKKLAEATTTLGEMEKAFGQYERLCEQKRANETAVVEKEARRNTLRSLLEGFKKREQSQKERNEYADRLRLVMEQLERIRETKREIERVEAALAVFGTTREAFTDEALAEVETSLAQIDLLSEQIRKKESALSATREEIARLSAEAVAARERLARLSPAAAQEQESLLQHLVEAGTVDLGAANEKISSDPTQSNLVRIKLLAERTRNQKKRVEELRQQAEELRLGRGGVFAGLLLLILGLAGASIGGVAIRAVVAGSALPVVKLFGGGNTPLARWGSRLVHALPGGVATALWALVAIGLVLTVASGALLLGRRKRRRLREKALAERAVLLDDTRTCEAELQSILNGRSVVDFAKEVDSLNTLKKTRKSIEDDIRSRDHFAETLEAELAQLRRQSGEAARALNAVFTRAQCPDLAGFRRELAEYKNLAAKRKSLEETQAVLAGGTSEEALEAEKALLGVELAARDAALAQAGSLIRPDEFVQYQDEFGRLEEESQQARARLVEVNNDLQNYRQHVLKGDPAELRGEAARLREELLELRRAERAARLARQLLQEAAGEAQSAAAPAMQERAGAILEKITNGRYRQVSIEVVENALQVKVFSPEAGGFVPPQALSTGTIDQLYLALRVALSEYLTNVPEFPVILDDPFVNFDTVRLEGVLEVCRKLAGRLQIICLTKDEHLAGELGLNGQVFRLAGLA
ncbi:MAG: AAA family ATPase [Firmicutes bacterium]|nr:AAA family ATPase [Bacillota bacterium]